MESDASLTESVKGLEEDLASLKEEVASGKIKWVNVPLNSCDDRDGAVYDLASGSNTNTKILKYTKSIWNVQDIEIISILPVYNSPSVTNVTIENNWVGGEYGRSSELVLQRFYCYPGTYYGAAYCSIWIYYSAPKDSYSNVAYPTSVRVCYVIKD